jgi:hypothetical protein
MRLRLRDFPGTNRKLPIVIRLPEKNPATRSKKTESTLPDGRKPSGLIRLNQFPLEGG